jgi:hypothetical protein
MRARSDLPEPVESVCSDWLSLVDQRSPGLVTGLYLRGGLAFGEWLPGPSDVDFVATLSRRPDDAALDALRSSHARLLEHHPDLPFDGMHVLAADLTVDPDECPDVPCVLHGFFEDEAREDLNPVGWHELAERGITVRGPAVEGIGVWTDAERVRSFTRENLDTYWRSNAELLAARPQEGEAEETCCWCVLGVARLHHLLVTGELTTKSGAGRWALAHLDERFHRVLREALRVREGGADEYAADRAQRGLDTAAFTAYVVEQGTRTGQ